MPDYTNILRILFVTKNCALCFSYYYNWALCVQIGMKIELLGPPQSMKIVATARKKSLFFHYSNFIYLVRIIEFKALLSIRIKTFKRYAQF